MKTLYMLAAFSLAAALFETPCHAGQITVTWTGTVLNGGDTADYFGYGAGADLTGKAFTATFVIDPTVGFLQTATDYFKTSGDSSVGYPSPLVSSTLTINGITYSYDSDYFGGYTRDATPGRSEIYTEANPSRPTGYDVLFLDYFQFDNSLPFTGLNENLSLNISSGGRGVFLARDPADNLLFSGNFNPTNVTIASGSSAATPEPASFLLLLSGLGLGAAVRMRRRAGALSVTHRCK